MMKLYQMKSKDTLLFYYMITWYRVLTRRALIWHVTSHFIELMFKNGLKAQFFEYKSMYLLEYMICKIVNFVS